jgi:hypothetical protein
MSSMMSSCYPYDSISLLHLIRTTAGLAMQVNLQQNVTISTGKLTEQSS